MLDEDQRYFRSDRWQPFSLPGPELDISYGCPMLIPRAANDGYPPALSQQNDLELINGIAR
jgi:hypothetical protein